MYGSKREGLREAPGGENTGVVTLAKELYAKIQSNPALVNHIGRNTPDSKVVAFARKK